MKYKQMHFELKEVKGEGVFTGYAAVFNNVDLGGDIIAPGAFTKTIQMKTDHPILWGHNPREPIGVNQSYSEDAKGLLVEGKLVLSVQRAQDAYELMKAGAVKGMSIGYDTVVDEYNFETDIRTLKELKLWEYSLTAFPMNPEAQVTGVKSTDEFDAEIRRLLRFLENRKSPLSVDRIALLEKLEKQVSALRTAQASGAATQQTIAPELIHALVKGRI